MYVWLEAHYRDREDTFVRTDVYSLQKAFLCAEPGHHRAMARASAPLSQPELYSETLAQRKETKSLREGKRQSQREKGRLGLGVALPASQYLTAL